MTQGGWSGNPFDANPASQNPFPVPNPGGPNSPGFPGPQPPPAENTVLATLSVVFAFVFAPVGAVLGHLAITQSQQRHRDRALVGLTLSYTFIVVAVVASVVWAVQSRPADATPALASPTATAMAPAPPPMTTTPPPSPPPPTVAPTDLSNLLPSPEEVGNIIGVPGLTPQKTTTELPTDAEEGPFEREAGECASAASGPTGRLYIDNRADGLFVRNDGSPAAEIVMGVAAFPDAASAQRFSAQSTDVWRRCPGKQVVQTLADGQQLKYAVGSPVEAGGITTLHNTVTMPNGAVGPTFLAAAAKENVAVMLIVMAQFSSTDQTVTLANRILDHIHP